MPDAHVGYGLPIGGVLATENAVIPYAVGVDIACRMKMTVLDIPVRDLERHQDRLTRAIEAETRFGVGAELQTPPSARGAGCRLVRQPGNQTEQGPGLGAAWDQRQRKPLCRVRPVYRPREDSAGLEPGTYVALLSHSGSRGTGAAVCDYYSKVAFSQFPDLPERIEAAGLAVTGFARKARSIGRRWS